MSVLDSILALNTGTYTVTRLAAGTRTLGKVTAGAPSTFEIVASVQPPSGRLLRVLAEGQLADDMRVVYTATELRIKDRITLAGERFDVSRVEPWEAFGESHWRAFCARAVAP